MFGSIKKDTGNDSVIVALKKQQDTLTIIAMALIFEKYGLSERHAKDLAVAYYEKKTTEHDKIFIYNAYEILRENGQEILIGHTEYNKNNPNADTASMLELLNATEKIKGEQMINVVDKMFGSLQSDK